MNLSAGTLAGDGGGGGGGGRVLCCVVFSLFDFLPLSPD